MSLSLNRRHFLGGSALAGGLIASPAWAKAAAKPVMRGISKSWPLIQTALDETIAKKVVPGVGGAVARGVDQAEFFVAGRLSRDADAAAITADTLWRCYSMTKPITGMAAMMLIEDGKLKMDQNIADILPEWANPQVLTNGDKDLKSRASMAPITIRNLLTHTAGLGYSIITKGPLLAEYCRLGITPGAISRKKLPGVPVCTPNAPSLDEFSKRLATLPLIADPGRKWSYSVSLDLMGRVIEVVSGMGFDAFVQQRILNPLGMTSTYWQVPQSEIYRLTTNHARTLLGTFAIDPGKESTFLDKPAFPFGGAGIVSSMRDYDRFLLMLMGEGAVGQTRIMKRETAVWGMSNLLHPDTETGGIVKGQGFGAGGRVTITPGPNGEGIGTYGWAGAASTVGWVDRARNVRASGWAQIMATGSDTISAEFGKAVYASL